MTISLRRSLFYTTAITALITGGTGRALALTHDLGGGSTLAQPTYVKEFSDDPSPGLDFTYCSVGSGAGTSAFVANSGTPLHADTTHAGCSTAAAPVDYGASDAFISAANVSAFPAADGPLIQVPMFGTPVTFALSKSVATSNGAETLTDAQLCGIFAGKITDWHTIDSSKFPAGTAITVAYRLDSSGTTFLTTTHLKAVCTDGTTFSSTQLSAMPTQTFQASLYPSGVPANFVGGTGSSGVEAVVNVTTNNAIGYLSPDYTDISTIGHNAGGAPFVAAVKNGNDLTAYLPNVTNTSLALGTITPPTGAAETTQSNWAPVVPNPAHGYPVAGYTYWFVSTCYNHTANPGVSTDLINFLTAHYNISGTSTGTKLVTDITNGGFVPVTGSNVSSAVTPGSFAAAINAAFLTGTDNQHLNIADTGSGSANTACQAVGITGR